ncbi:MAG: hypothetical protein WCK88_03320 [bacterium]
METDAGIYQTIQGSVLDNKIPTMELKYFTKYNPVINSGPTTSDDVSNLVAANKWFNEDVTTRVKCINTLGDSNKASNVDGICQCAPQIPNLSTTTWISPSFNALSFSPKYFYYTTSTTFASRSVAVEDTAVSPQDSSQDGNRSALQNTYQIKIDKKPPVLASTAITA